MNKNNYYDEDNVFLTIEVRKNKIASQAVALMKKGGKLVKGIKDFTGMIRLKGIDAEKLAINLDEINLQNGSSFEDQTELQKVINNLGNDINNIGGHMQKMYEKNERKEQVRNFVITSAKNFSKGELSPLKFALVHFDAYNYTKQIQEGIELAFADLANGIDAFEFVPFNSQLMCIAYYEVLKACRSNEEFNTSTPENDRIRMQEIIRRNVFSNLIEKISDSNVRKENLNQMEEKAKNYCDTYSKEMESYDEKQNLTSNNNNIPEQIYLGFSDALTEYFNNVKSISAEYFHSNPESSLGYMLMKTYLQAHSTEGIDFVNKEFLFLKVYAEVLKNNNTVQKSLESKTEQYQDDFMEITKNVNSLYQQLYAEDLDENSKKSAGKLLNDLYNSIKNDTQKLEIYNAAIDTCKSQLVSTWKKGLDENQIQLDFSNLLFLAVERELANRELETSKLNEQVNKEEVIKEVSSKEEPVEEKVAEPDMDHKSIVVEDLTDAIDFLKNMEEVKSEKLVKSGEDKHTVTREEEKMEVEDSKETIDNGIKQKNEFSKEIEEVVAEDLSKPIEMVNPINIIPPVNEEIQSDINKSSLLAQTKVETNNDQPKEIQNQMMRVNDAIETIMLETKRLMEQQNIQKENNYITTINSQKNQLFEAVKENDIIKRKYQNQETIHASELEKVRTDAQNKIDKIQQKANEEILNKDTIISEKETELNQKDKLLSAALLTNESQAKENTKLTDKVSSLEEENTKLTDKVSSLEKENENLKMTINQILNFAQGNITMQNNSVDTPIKK